VNSLSDIIEKPNCSLTIELQEGFLFIDNAHRFIRTNAKDKQMHELLRIVLNNYTTSIRSEVGKRPRKTIRK
jgi:hypothetical protein